MSMKGNVFLASLSLYCSLCLSVCLNRDGYSWRIQIILRSAQHDRKVSEPWEKKASKWTKLRKKFNKVFEDFAKLARKGIRKLYGVVSKIKNFVDLSYPNKTTKLTSLFYNRAIIIVFTYTQSYSNGTWHSHYQKCRVTYYRNAAT